MLLPLRVVGALALLGACKSEPCPAGSTRQDDGLCYLDDSDEEGGGEEGGEEGGDEGGGDDTGEPVEWLDIPQGCDSSATGEDPVSLVSELRYIQDFGDPSSRLVELVDIWHDADTNRVYGSGQGGFFIWDVSDPTDPQELLAHPSSGMGARYHRSVVRGDTGWLVNRDSGMSILNLSDLSDVTDKPGKYEAGMSSIKLVDGALVLLDHEGRVRTYDIGDHGQGGEERDPVLLAETEVGSSFWDMVVTDAGVGFAADQLEGLVVVDLSDVTAPVRLGGNDLGGIGSQDVAVSGDVAYLAIGGFGIAIVDVSDPSNPALLGTVDYGASVQSVAVDGELLWAANQESVLVLDISDPASPVPLGSKATEQWAMHITAGSGYAWVGDWNLMSAWAVDRSNPQPDADLNPSEVYVRQDGDSFVLELSNRGSVDLELLGAEAGSDLVTLQADRLSIAPGETALVRVSYAGGAALEDEVCLATNDPGAPVITVALHTGEQGQNEAIGDPAPDFALQDLDGTTHVLSEQLGHPVVLAYFATW